MKLSLNGILLFVCFTAVTMARVISTEEESATPASPPKPYAFGYAAGRFPGHIDRTHSEVSDASGVVQGSYSYVDPTFKIRKVDYIADKTGFHPVLNHNVPALPQDTPVVAAAKQRHLIQYSRIASRHQQLPEVVVPADTKAVQFAKNRHLSLFQKIEEEHARIAAERATLNQQEDSSLHPNALEQKNEY
ncbi:cuticle protein 19.8-like [Euwallacea similis]|uniref:cuticle protein 19.8-like n=1 Tax=Euwallacea similis TaxID=1736056 RepID=UPI00344F3C74